MRSAAGRIVLKIVILLGCIGCVITKALTDQLSRRVFLRNQKLSREWGLLHNLYWSSSGNAFANVTYGGFTLITVLMLICRFIDARSRPALIEKIFLTVGMLCFFAMGGIVFSAYDQVPADLHVSAIVLGSLSFAVALLMLVDLADPMARHTSDTTQTDFEPQRTAMTAQNLHPPHSAINQRQLQPLAVGEIKDGLDNAAQFVQPHQPQNYVPTVEQRQELQPPQPSQQHPMSVAAANGQYTRADTVDYVQARAMPVVQQPSVEHLHPIPHVVSVAHPPAFEQRLWPEKQRPHRHQHGNVGQPQSHLQHQQQREPQPNHQLPQQQQHQLQYSNLAQLQLRQTDHRRPAVQPPPRPVPPPLPHRSVTAQPARPQQHQRQTQPQQQHHQQRHYARSASSDRNQRGSDRRGRPPIACGLSEPEDEDEVDSRMSRGSQRAPRSPIQPGFVAHAARFWDQRAAAQQQQQGSELNTIV